MKKNYPFRDNRTSAGIVLSAAAAMGVAAFLVSQEPAAVGSDLVKNTPASPAAAAAPVKTVTSVPATSAPAPASAGIPDFAYGGPAFTKFIQGSYAYAPAGTPAFYPWFESRYEKSHVRFKGLETAKTIPALLSAIRTKYEATTDPEKRADIEKQTGAYAWKLLKKTIPKFSLDRGFEFYNSVRRGERQCYLQSALVSGMMQAAGMKAGVVMVARSDEGEESNNGHAVALVKLSNGTDCLVDVSDHHTPFVKQQRLMAADSGSGKYRYVVPQYTANGAAITGYTAPENGAESIAIAGVAPLSMKYMVSQFDYYRGERAPGGFDSLHKTTAGLEASSRFLKKALDEDPNNPLAEYVLGRVSLRQGRHAEAKQELTAAYRLYDSYGFVPDGAREALALVGATPQRLAER